MYDGSQGYSKITRFSIKNFECIENGQVEFDASNILVIKGFNSSGKSSLIRAFRVVLEDFCHSRQKMFIAHDATYFLLKLEFDDGVSITRAKYKTGQSLYLMEKNGVTIFTNKCGREFTPVKEMPDVIRDYLGIHKFQKRVINFQDCKEDFLLVDTSPADNYKMLGKASDDGSLPLSLEKLKKEQSGLQTEIIVSDNNIAKYTALIESNNTGTQEIIDFLKERDANCDHINDCYEAIKTINRNTINVLSMPDSDYAVPEMDRGILDIGKAVRQLRGNIAEATREIYKEYPVKKQLLEEGKALNKIRKCLGVMDTEIIADEYHQPEMAHGIGAVLLNIREALNSMDKVDKRVEYLDNGLSDLRAYMSDMQYSMAECGKIMTKCPNCGTYHVADVRGCDE